MSGDRMNRRWLALALLVVSGGPAWAEGEWLYGRMSDGTYWASAEIGGRHLSLYCRDGQHEFAFDMRQKLVDPELLARKYVDLVVAVDARGEETTYDRTEVSFAAVETYSDMVSFRTYGYTAWGLASIVAFSDQATISVSLKYDDEHPVLTQTTPYFTATSQAETAAGSVLGPCVPKRP